MFNANKMFMADLIIVSCWESEADADVSDDYCSALTQGELRSSIQCHSSQGLDTQKIFAFN